MDSLVKNIDRCSENHNYVISNVKDVRVIEILKNQIITLHRIKNILEQK
jgi:hypothetical protein